MRAAPGLRVAGVGGAGIAVIAVVRHEDAPRRRIARIDGACIPVIAGDRAVTAKTCRYIANIGRASIVVITIRI